jgi:hypothetical protein
MDRMPAWRFINGSVHGVLDYLVDATLIAGPILFYYLYSATAGPIETWVPIAIGVANLIYSRITAYSHGLRQMISFRTHLWLDFLVGVVLLVTPFLFGIRGVPMWFMVAMGAAIVVAVAFTDPDRP